jgi:hypothetical protein
MSNAHNLEAREHLVRIQARMAADAVSRQRELTERLANTRVSDLGQSTLAAILAEQGEHNPYCEPVLASINRGVDAACHALGLDLQNGVVTGVLPRRGLGAFSSDFYGTGVAIVAIDSAVVPFTGMLTDLLAESFEYRETADGLAIVMDERSCLERIIGGKTLVESSLDAREGRDTLVHYWECFFLHFAGLSMPWPKAELTEAQKAIKFQLTSAMEVFVVGHEYGHHINRHNSGVSASSFVPTDEAHGHELEADRTAWIIAKFLGAVGFAGKPTEVRNTWMESSAGAVAYLVAAEVARRVREILETGTADEQQSMSHPSLNDRLWALERWNGFDDEPLKADFHHQRRFLGNVISGVYNHLKLKFVAAHREGFRPTHF